MGRKTVLFSFSKATRILCPNWQWNQRKKTFADWRTPRSHKNYCFCRAFHLEITLSALLTASSCHFTHYRNLATHLVRDGSLLIGYQVKKILLAWKWNIAVTNNIMVGWGSTYNYGKYEYLHWTSGQLLWLEKSVNHKELKLSFFISYEKQWQCKYYGVFWYHCNAQM